MKKMDDQLKDLKAQMKALKKYAKLQKVFLIQFFHYSLFQAGKNPPPHNHEGWPKWPTKYEASKKRVSGLLPLLYNPF